MIGVVKANAYGHGAVPVARTLVGAGVERLAIATVDEAIELREAGIEVPLVLLWGIGPDEASIVTEHALEPIVYDDRAIELLEAAADRDGVRIGVHLKVDTGLGRQGAAPDEAVALAIRIARSRHLRLAGTMSHLAVPGEDDAYTEVQVLRLARVLDGVRSAGVDPGLVHVSASWRPAGRRAHLRRCGPTRPGAVRPAARLGGGSRRRPHPGTDPPRAGRFGSSTCPPARRSATGCASARRATRGSRRSASGMATGGRASTPTTAGRSSAAGARRSLEPISMDGLTVDLEGIDGVTYGDEFVLIGEQDGARITADEVAAERRTINYEVTTALRERLPRLHRGVD